jgi:regulator of replication initiation timing
MMTDNLLQILEEKLQKLDEKMMLLLTEIEDSHGEIQRLTEENSLMKIERQKHAELLEKLIGKLEMISSADSMISNALTPAAMKPALAQG